MKEKTANSRIAKNTILLYIRMLLLMGVALYTSRVVLDTLGVEDYGLYNVVGGIVTMFTFLSSAMGASSQRFITFILGKNDAKELKAVFNTTCLVHWILALLIFALSATIGLWFLYKKMVIPENRFDAALWVYIFSVLSCLVSVISIPYNALVIAHEKMGIFSFISVLYAIVKLGVVFIVKHTGFDHLIFYAGLLLIAQISERLAYQFYCKAKFPESRGRSLKDTMQVKKMMSFAGWSLLPNLATVCYSQGINILLNLFFGPAVNAARGISVQIQGVVKNFITNFQTAVSPQIIKSYALGDSERLFSLIFKSSRLSFYFLLCISLPIFLEADYLLSIWLKEVPQHSASFVRLIILAIVLDPLANPLCVANNATGNVKLFKMCESAICLLVIPIGYTLLKIGLSPESVFVTQVILSIIVQIARVMLSKNTLHFTYKDYLQKVLVYIVRVGVISIIIPVIFKIYLNNTFISFMTIVALSVLSVVATTYTLGLSQGERRSINGKIYSFLSKSKSK